MAKHFGAQHQKSNYSAMGGAIGRPYHASAKTRSVSESIARNREIAARMARATGGKKKK